MSANADIDHQALAWRFHSRWMAEDRNRVFRDLCRLNRWDFALVVSLIRPLFEREDRGFWLTLEDRILVRADRARERQEDGTS